MFFQNVKTSCYTLHMCNPLKYERSEHPEIPTDTSLDILVMETLLFISHGHKAFKIIEK